MNDRTNSDVVHLEQDSRHEVEIDQCCLAPDTHVTEPQTVTGTATAVSECHNCANHKMKFNRLQETYRKAKAMLEISMIICEGHLGCRGSDDNYRKKSGGRCLEGLLEVKWQPDSGYWASRIFL